MTARLIKKIQQILKKSSPQIYKGVAIAISGNFADISLPDGKQVRAEALNKISRNQNVAVIYDGNNNYYCWFQGSSGRGIVNKEIITEIRKRPRPGKGFFDFGILYSKLTDEQTTCVKPYFDINQNCATTCSLTEYDNLTACEEALDLAFRERNTTQIYGGTLVNVAVTITAYDPGASTSTSLAAIGESFNTAVALNLRFGGASDIVDAYLSVVGISGASSSGLDPLEVSPASFTNTYGDGLVRTLGGGGANVTNSVDFLNEIFSSSPVRLDDFPVIQRSRSYSSSDSYSTLALAIYPGNIISGSESFPGRPVNSQTIGDVFENQIQFDPCLIAVPTDSFLQRTAGSGTIYSDKAVFGILDASHSVAGLFVGGSPGNLTLNEKDIPVTCFFKYIITYNYVQTRATIADTDAFKNLMGITNTNVPVDIIGAENYLIRECTDPNVPPPETPPDESKTKEYYLKINNARVPLLLSKFNENEILNYYLSTDGQYYYIAFKAGQENFESHHKIFFYKIDRQSKILDSKTATNPEELDIDNSVNFSQNIWNFDLIKVYNLSLDLEVDLELFDGNRCFFDFANSNRDFGRFGNFNAKRSDRNTFYYLIGIDDITSVALIKSLTQKVKFYLQTEKQIVTEDGECQIPAPKRFKKVLVNPLTQEKDLTDEEIDLYSILQIVFLVAQK